MNRPYNMKYNFAGRGKSPDLLPMWVADMDFAAPPCVVQAMEEHARLGVYGYAEPDAAFFDTVESWFARRHGWAVSRDGMTLTPGVVTALYVAIRAFTRKGDGVLIQQPVYHPFGFAIHDTRRTPIVNELHYENGAYSINFDDFEEKARRAKLFILCSPHNPVGRVWTRDELTRMGEICLRHNVTIVADEIWQDLVHAPHKNISFATLSPELADITLTTTAPSKTFNLAGFQLAMMITSNEALHRAFKQTFNDSGLFQPSLAGLVSCRAAYTQGEPWLAALLEKLAANVRTLDKFLQKNIPAIKLVQPQGTYMAWLDCHNLCAEKNIAPDDLDAHFTENAKLWLSNGQSFGAGGQGFMRMNLACPTETLAEALRRLEGVI